MKAKTESASARGRVAASSGSSSSSDAAFDFDVLLMKCNTIAGSRDSQARHSLTHPLAQADRLLSTDQADERVRASERRDKEQQQ